LVRLAGTVDRVGHHREGEGDEEQELPSYRLPRA
jgi:hypothetical protein